MGWNKIYIEVMKYFSNKMCSKQYKVQYKISNSHLTLVKFFLIIINMYDVVLFSDWVRSNLDINPVSAKWMLLLPVIRLTLSLIYCSVCRHLKANHQHLYKLEMCTISHLLCDKKQLSCFYSKILKDKSMNELMFYFFFGGGSEIKSHIHQTNAY